MASETEHLKGVEPEVLGQRFLRVFTLAGDCILEKRHEEIRHHRSVGDIIQLLCQKMDLKPCRLVLLDGRMRLKPQQPLTIWPPSDWELQVVTVPGPSLDVGRELSLKPARILAVERRGCEINVRIEPGKLLEEVDEDVRLHHLVTLTAPPFESMVEVEVQGNDALLPLESFMAGPGLSCGFDELKIHYGQVTLRYWATGEFHSELGGGTVTQQGCPAKKGGLLREICVFCGYWLLDIFSILCACWLVASFPWLLATLWLPGVAFIRRFRARSWLLRCLVLLLGPGALIVAALVVPVYFGHKLFLLLLQLHGCRQGAAALPLAPDTYVLYEVYASDVRLLGDAPRLLLLGACWLTGAHEALPGLLASSASLLLMLGPRQRLRLEAKEHFEKMIQDEELLEVG